MPRLTITQLTEQLETAQNELQGAKDALAVSQGEATRFKEDRDWFSEENSRLNDLVHQLGNQLGTMEAANRTVAKLADVSKAAIEVTAGQSAQQGETIGVLHDVIDRIMVWHETDRLERAVDRLGETFGSKDKPGTEPKTAE